jgi:hypothetical protein
MESRMAVQKANYVWRDYETDGVSASGFHKPIPRELRKWGTNVEQMMLGAAAGATIYDSKTAMDDDTSQDANAMAWVLGDDTAANNGVYQFDGTDTWTRLGDLPYSYIKASNAGAGTANAIVATTSIPIPAADGAVLIALPIVVDNTATPVTVAFNGGSALTIKTNSGNSPAVGGLTAGMIVAGYVSGSTLRLLSDQASAAVLAACEAAQAAAEDAAIYTADDPDAVAMPFLQRLRDLPIPMTEFADSALKTAISAGTLTDADDEECTDAMQKSIDFVRDAGRGEIDVRPGTYVHRTLSLPTKTVLRGIPGRTLWQVSANQPDDGSPIIKMDSMDGSLGDYDQSDVTFENIIVDGGSRTLTTVVPLLRALSIDRFTMRGCELRNHYYILANISGAREVRVEGCRFHGYGIQEDAWTNYTGGGDGTAAFTEGGAALYIGANALDDDAPYSEKVWLLNNRIHDGEWAAIYMFCQQMFIMGNLVENTKEAIFSTNRDSGPSSAFGQMGRSIIANNIVMTTKQKYIQGAGMELGLKNVIVTGNYVEGCDGAGLDFKGDCENVEITNNVLVDNLRNRLEWNLFASDGDYGQLVVRNLSSPAPEIAPIDVTIRGNKIRDTEETPIAAHAISLFNSGSNAKASGLVVEDNDVRDSYAVSPILVHSGLVSSTDYIVQNNKGAETVLSPSLTWTPTISTTTGTTGVFAVNAAHYRRASGKVSWQLQITITDIGDAGGNLKVTLPSPSPFRAAFMGSNISAGYGLMGQVSSSSDVVNISRSSSGSFPGATGNVLLIGGEYLEA